MRPHFFVFIIIIIAVLTNCKQSNHNDCNTLKTEFYETGKIKNILSVNAANFRDGECLYFNQYGFLDSSVTFSNGVLHGIKKVFYDNQTDTYEYDKGNLISESVYDSLNVLIYKTPVDVKIIGKTRIKFLSNRNYIYSGKVDTFTISNEGLPSYNRGIEVTGGLIERLHYDTFTIRSSKHPSNINHIILKVLAHQNIGDTTEKGKVIDSLIIRVK